MAKKLKIVEVGKADSRKEIINDIILLRTVMSQKNELDKKEKELKERINKYVDANMLADNKGNRYFETVGMDGKAIILKREKRESRKLNNEMAVAFFRKAGMLGRVAKEKITYEFDEDAIMKLYEDKTISMGDIENISDVSVTYATKFVKAVEEEEDATKN
jgi:hypothetical protein